MTAAHLLSPLQKVKNKKFLFSSRQFGHFTVLKCDEDVKNNLKKAAKKVSNTCRKLHMIIYKNQESFKWLFFFLRVVSFLTALKLYYLSIHSSKNQVTKILYIQVIMRELNTMIYLNMFHMMTRIIMSMEFCKLLFTYCIKLDVVLMPFFVREFWKFTFVRMTFIASYNFCSMWIIKKCIISLISNKDVKTIMSHYTKLKTGYCSRQPHNLNNR